MKTIRASNGTRFEFTETQLVETKDNTPYFLYRRDLRGALLSNVDGVSCGVARRNELFDNPRVVMVGDLNQGVTQRNKKFIQIGCMHFVGKNRAALIRWAKAAK